MTKPLALVVEDDHDLAIIFAEAFEAADYNSEVTHNGEDAVELLKTIKPAIILLDMHLPKMSGQAVLEHVRSTEPLADIRVIIATADDMAAVGRPSQLANFTLIKPVRFQQLKLLASRLYPS